MVAPATVGFGGLAGGGAGALGGGGGGFGGGGGGGRNTSNKLMGADLSGTWEAHRADTRPRFPDAFPERTTTSTHHVRASIALTHLPRGTNDGRQKRAPNGVTSQVPRTTPHSSWMPHAASRSKPSHASNASGGGGGGRNGRQKRAPPDAVTHTPSTVRPGSTTSHALPSVPSWHASNASGGGTGMGGGGSRH